MSHRTGRSLRLAMVNLRFEPHGTFDRLGDKAILLRFLKHPRHSSEILDGRDHDPRLNYDLGNLATALLALSRAYFLLSKKSSPSAASNAQQLSAELA